MVFKKSKKTYEQKKNVVKLMMIGHTHSSWLKWITGLVIAEHHEVGLDQSTVALRNETLATTTKNRKPMWENIQSNGSKRGLLFKLGDSEGFGS